MARLSGAKIDEAVNTFAKKLRKEARGNLTRSKARASSTLWKSIGYRYEKGRLTIRMATYGVFLDRGVTGHGRATYKPRKMRQRARSLSGFKFKKGPVGPAADQSFRDWIRARNIKVRDNQGRFVKRATASFMIRRSVGRFGIQPRRFFTDAWERLLPEFDKALERAATRDVEQAVDNILKTKLS